MAVMTSTGVDAVGEESEDFTGGSVWERSVWGLGEEIVPELGGVSMAELEARGAEGWGEGR